MAPRSKRAIDAELRHKAICALVDAGWKDPAIARALHLAQITVRRHARRYLRSRTSAPTTYDYRARAPRRATVQALGIAAIIERALTEG